MNRRNALRTIATLALGGPAIVSAQERCKTPDYQGMTACEVGIPSWKGNAILRQQPSLSQWCWAASMEMVFAHYGHRVPMKRIVTEVYGRTVNLPAPSWTIVQQLSREWEDEDGETFSCQCDVLWDTAAGYGKAAPDQIASQYLHRQMPLIIGTQGHAMVLTALSYVKHVVNTSYGSVTTATVRDPYPGRGGRRVLSQQEWYGTNFLVVPIVS
jgi:hypothetical protein